MEGFSLSTGTRRGFEQASRRSVERGQAGSHIKLRGSMHTYWSSGEPAKLRVMFWNSCSSASLSGMSEGVLGSR